MIAVDSEVETGLPARDRWDVSDDLVERRGGMELEKKRSRIKE